MVYNYRKLFGLSAEEFENEPVDDFFINSKIYGWIEEKKARQAKADSK